MLVDWVMEMTLVGFDRKFEVLLTRPFCGSTVCPVPAGGIGGKVAFDRKSEVSEMRCSRGSILGCRSTEESM